jgi:hypothetical protein
VETADSSLRRRVRSGFGRNDKGVCRRILAGSGLNDEGNFQFQQNLVKGEKLRESG